MGEPLAQPPLHAARGDQHQFLGERVGQGIGQQRTEPVGEAVGAISTMEMNAIARQTTTVLLSLPTSRLSSPSTRPNSSTIQLGHPRSR